METQPSLRAIWLGQSNWALWGAVSKAVRTPSRFERHINSLITAFDPYTEFNQTPLPINVYLVGSSDFDIEKMVAYEIGFRKTFENGAALDLTAYQQDYSELLTPRTSEPVVNFGYPFGPDGPALPVSVDQAVILVNGDGGSISGVEASLTFKPLKNWTLTALADVRDPDLPSSTFSSNDAALVQFAGASPSWQAQLRSHHEISDKVDLTWTVRQVSELEGGIADAYTDLDIRASWQVTNKLELSLIGENLAEEYRAETESGVYPAPTGYVERRVLLRAGLRF